MHTHQGFRRRKNPPAGGRAPLALPVFCSVWLFALGGAAADWPMLRGEARHTGFVEEEIQPPYRLAWAREFTGERLGTAMEPILAGGRVYVATHAGGLYALRADTGEAEWRFRIDGAFLHSPAVAQGVVIAAGTDGFLYGLEAPTGRIKWRLETGAGGFSAAPVAAGEAVFIGHRRGDFLAVSARDGKLLWWQNLGAPLRQTAAVAEGSVFVTAEDMRVRCLRAGDGAPVWTSPPLAGQTARDYYPVVVSRGGRTRVVVRTNPLLNMGQRLGRDRTLLCRNAGVDDSGWQKVDAWVKSAAAHGSPALWQKEQEAVAEYLRADPAARSFFVLDAATGAQAAPAPVLWAAGCQGVGAPPALAADGRLLVFHRSAYGNWSLGVAPLVALGLLDPAENRVTPLFHQRGQQPPWNCFWGTADESQNFLVAGRTVLAVHQGTLSGFRLDGGDLFPIRGERDSYGGFRNPPWARNEWHGPGRGGVAVAGRRIYWLTGSRLLCLESGGPAAGPAPKPEPVAKPGSAGQAAIPMGPGRRELIRQLEATVEAVLSRRWAPLFTDPGLAGRCFSFDRSGEWFEALAWAFPHLPAELQDRVKSALREEWRAHPPGSAAAWPSLREGERREWFAVPLDYCARLGGGRLPHPFGNLAGAVLAARRCREPGWVRDGWPGLQAAFHDFTRTGWRLDPARGDPYANLYLAALQAFIEAASLVNDPAAAAPAKTLAGETSAALIAWWQRAAERGTLQSFHSSAELDPFIGHGDGIFLAVAPHRHQLALFQDLTPEIARLVVAGAPAAVEAVWGTFETLCPTWALVGEERQVHYGENFVDPPGFAGGAFKALAWLRKAPAAELSRRVDLPFCQADLYYLTKLALALEALAPKY